MSGALWWGGLSVVVGAAAWAAIQIRSSLIVGAGYKAKVLCTAYFGSGRALDPVRADQISADSYLVLRLFKATVDHAARSISTSTFGILKRTKTLKPDL